jgi:hypothetical protein
MYAVMNILNRIMQQENNELFGGEKENDADIWITCLDFIKHSQITNTYNR